MVILEYKIIYYIKNVPFIIISGQLFHPAIFDFVQKIIEIHHSSGVFKSLHLWITF